jgi:hypothetical protein
VVGGRGARGGCVDAPSVVQERRVDHEVDGDGLARDSLHSRTWERDLGGGCQGFGAGFEEGCGKRGLAEFGAGFGRGFWTGCGRQFCAGFVAGLGAGSGDAVRLPLTA